MSRAFSPLSLGVGLTALLALVPGLGLGSKAPRTDAPLTTKAAEAPKCDRKVEAVGALLDQCLRDRPQAGTAPVAVTILTLPDPQRTNMGLWFDLRLEAVQRAFKASDFLPRAFYLPWEARAKEEGGGGITSDFVENGPGLIWFAREGVQPTYHALLIVGESQALGLNREAFRQALMLASRVPASKEGRRISILGPQFSGSLSSLGAALEAHFRDPEAAAIRIQGTTTLDPGGVRILMAALGNVGPQRLQVSPWICNLSGASKNSLLAWYVAEAGWPQDESKIALFTESNTIYSRDKTTGLRITPILFPMGLSRLRSERRSMERNLAKGAEAQDLVLPSTLLGPADDDALRVLDTVPQYSPDTVRNTELTLAGTILSLARRGYTHIGISASDPQDLLFLAERIRAYHPTCTLFTTSGNHALFAHPNHSQAMDGMVLFGGYAVTDAVRVLSLKKGDLESPVRFTSEGEYATYYATRILLDPAAVRDAERPFWGKQGLVSIVKGGSIWPLRHGGLEVTRDGGPMWDREVEGRYREVATASQDLVQYVHSRLRQLAMLLAVLGLASMLAFLRPLHQVAGVSSGEPGLRAYGYLVSGAVLALAVHTLLATGYLLPLVLLRGGPGRDPYLWMSLGLWGAHLLATGWCLRGRLGGSWAVALLGSALLPSAAVLVWGPTHFLVFMPAYLRFSSPGRGVSLIPCMLLLAAGVALLLRTWFEVRRQDHQVFWPEPFGIAERKVLALRHLRGLHFQPWIFGIVALLLGFQLVLPGGLIRPLMEVQGITLVVVATGASLAIASGFLFWQFHQGWKETRGVLELLNMTPYRAAFAEVGKLIEWKAMTALGRGLSMRRSSLRGRELLRDQAGWISAVVPGFQACLGALTDLDEKISRSRRSLGEYENWRNRLAIAHQLSTCGDTLAAACAKDPAAAAAHQAEVDLFSALRAVHFIRQAFLVLRAQLIGSLGTLILVILGVAAFDFQPKGDVLLILSGTLAAMALWVTLVILAMERDPLLCLMEGSQPGEVQFSLGLLENGFRFVVVPLLLLLATLNPSFGGVLTQVFNPLMHLLK